jgi:hypothetical protein
MGSPGSKVLVFGDVHGELGWLARLIRRAASLNIETLLSVGDLGIGPWPGSGGGSTFEQKLDRICRANGVTLFVCAGNHDNWGTIDKLTPRADGWLELRERVLVAPRGHRWDWAGVRFGALPGAFSVDHSYRTDGRDWWPQEDVHPEDVTALGSEPLDVLVSHEVPAGIGGLFQPHKLDADTEARAQVSRDLLAQAVQQTRPAMVLCGHWHQRLTAHIPLPEGAHPQRRTTRVEVLDLGAEYMPGGPTDRNYVVLDLPALKLTEQRDIEARP